MRLYTYQHPAILETLQHGERHTCPWEQVCGERWQQAFHWMADQMAERGIEMGGHAPVWTWHSVNRIGGKPDMDCAHALLSDLQIEPGVVLLELEVPEHQALASCYNAWNLILDRFIDGASPEDQMTADCFSVRLTPRRGRPPARFPGIQACLPYIDPSWVRSWELLDTEQMLVERKTRYEATKQFYEAYQSIEWKFDPMPQLLTEKYPRTHHFPFSKGATNDDRIQQDWQALLQHELVVTEKLDGENSCLKSNGVYARSHGAVNRNPWARPVWDIWERVGHSLGDLHVFGENLYAIHSIEYQYLTHYFYVFAIRDGETWLSWKEVLEYAQLLELPVVPVLHLGTLTEEKLKTLVEQQQKNGSRLGGVSEGVVCRRAASFEDAEFQDSVLKYVRKDHVQTDEHWTRNWKKASLYSETAD